MKDLTVDIEEADCRIIPHIAYSLKNNMNRIIVGSNDTDVVVYLIYCFHKYLEMGCSELWVKYGTGDKNRYIPVHVISQEIGENMSSILLKLHIITDCDVTSKIGTKEAALKANPEKYLQEFGEKELNGDSFRKAEEYIVNVIKLNCNCMSLDELRYQQYTSKNKNVVNLAPTSYSIQGHLERCFYFFHLASSLLFSGHEIRSPLNYGWKLSSGILMPCKYYRDIPDSYVVTCSCKKGCQKACGCNKFDQICTEYCNCENWNNL